MNSDCTRRLHLIVAVAVVVSGAALLSARVPDSIGVAAGQNTSQEAVQASRDAGIVLSSGAAVDVMSASASAEFVTSGQRTIRALERFSLSSGAQDISRLSDSTGLVRLSETVIVVLEPVPYDIQYVPAQSAVGGPVAVWNPGTGGIRERTFRLRYEDDVLVSRVLVSDSLLELPADDALAVGKSVYRGGAISEFYMEATAYSPTVQETDGNPWMTASGMKSGQGVVAVDPSIIPLGSKLYVEEYGYAIAGDTGGAIKGNRIDVFFYSSDEMVAWGRRRVRVFVLP